MNVTPGIAPTLARTTADAPSVGQASDAKTAAQVKAARSRSNSWFSQVKQREARLQAAEDKALHKEERKKERSEARQEAREARESRRSSFLGNTLRRLSSGSSKRDRRSSTSSLHTTVSETGTSVQNLRVTLNRNTRRKRPNIPELKGTTLRRVCFQLDELVGLRTYEQVEADLPTSSTSATSPEKNYPTVMDMTIIDPYSSSTPLDRADLYQQCCKVYKIPSIPEIDKQLRSRGPTGVSYEGPRSLILRNIDLSGNAAVALADCLGLPLTGKHLTEVVFDNCNLTDSELQLLLSCLYTSAKIEKLDVCGNPAVTMKGIRCALCFLCLSPQVRRFAWQGPQFDSECARIVANILANTTVRALTELGFAHGRVGFEDLKMLLPIAQQAGVYGINLDGINPSDQSIALLGSMMTGPHAIQFLEMSDNQLDTQVRTFCNALDETSPLISLAVNSCSLSPGAITELFESLSRLRNFRRLRIGGHDLRPLVPFLKTQLPKFRILRRLDLSHSQLESRDVIVLCEILADAKISQLVLRGLSLDVPALSALYALARASQSLVNLDIDIPKDIQSETLGRRILAECLRNMEMQEASLQTIETDKIAMTQNQLNDIIRNEASIGTHQDLHEGAQILATALDQHLDNTDNEIATGLPLAMLERARHIKRTIEPALSEPLPELQLRRLNLVLETLENVILRFEETHPECRLPDMTARPTEGLADTYEHTGRSRADYIPQRGTGQERLRSRQLEAEEGEIMKLANRMADRLNILKSASASASPSRGPSRAELADHAETSMLEQINQADGDVLKNRLYELQSQGYSYDRAPLGKTLS